MCELLGPEMSKIKAVLNCQFSYELEEMVINGIIVVFGSKFVFL